MMTQTARVAPAAEAPLTEQISSLVSRDLRAYLLGSVEIDGARSEGVVVRSLLLMAVESMRLADPAEYERRVRAGESELVDRDRAREARVAAVGNR